MAPTAAVRRSVVILSVADLEVGRIDEHHRRDGIGALDQGRHRRAPVLTDDEVAFPNGY